ncbi:carboxypeptidase-like regulatory domain-containing protein [uncultured Allomuricauda sp.]|uniref:carboxypeptidase-like regulatory domain-containing protein n=1 Tax=Flagellimonas sp. W118 TaxID=3410791 RepID=UPI00261B703C|nr:carboxypeptidase-like regulatory domain-containing protein [uncultured Allomuricauda sp.]
MRQYQNIILSLLCYFSIHACFSQKAISGKIIDDNGTPLPFVHIRFENSNIGTISNENGVFQFATNKDVGKKSIIISAIGYKTEKILFQEEYQIISLKQDIIALDGVILSPEDYGKQLVEKAINAIPLNYPKVEERHTGFVREVTSWENKKNPIYVVEAVLESIKKSYTKKNLSGDVKLIEFRKYQSEQLDSLNTRIYAGSHHIHRFDIVSRKEAFLGKPNDFIYKIKDTLLQYGEKIYLVHFEKKSKLSGQIYIADSSFAIVKVVIDQHFSSKTLTNNRQYLKYTITYEQGEDEKWRFKHSHYETAFDKKDGLFKLTSDYVTTKVETNKDVIPYTDKLQYGDILLNKSKQYELGFWSGYNIIIPNQKTESLFKSMDYLNKKNDKRKNKFVDFLLRIDHDISIIGTWITMNTNTITFNNPSLVVQENLTSSKEYVTGLSYSLMYEIKPNIFLGYANESKISKTGTTSHDVSIANRFNLNPNGRPIFIYPSVNFGYQKLDFLIGSYSRTGDLIVNGKSFDTAKLDVFLSQKNYRLNPNISLGIEKSRRFLFKISIGHNFQFNEKKGVFFREKDGFFALRKSTFLNNGKENLSINPSNNDLLQNNINIKTGIVFSF